MQQLTDSEGYINNKEAMNLRRHSRGDIKGVGGGRNNVIIYFNEKIVK